MDHLDVEQVGDWRKGKRGVKRLAQRDPSVKLVDASFFGPLARLARTMKHLVVREGSSRFPSSTVSADIAVMLNQLIVTFDLLCFLNADERRDNDPDYRLSYSFVALPLIRTLIDGFYNITVLLDDPYKGRLFRLSGYKRMLAALKVDEDQYGTEKGWPEYIKQQRELLQIGYTADGFTYSELHSKDDWVLLGRYLPSLPADDSDHQKLVRRFTFGFWRQYSEISHVTFRGVHELFEFLNREDAPHYYRPAISARAERALTQHIGRAERALTQHIGRAAAVLVALITEIQAAYRFTGHNVNSRIHEAWRGMVNFPDGEDIYNFHYKALMEAKKIVDVPSDPA